MKVLEVNNLKLGFGRKKVLEDVSFSVEKGKVVGYVGKNASGKTTTIKSIMGLYAPENGNIALFGEKNRRKQIKLRRKVGYVPEVHEYYEAISVKGALEYVGSFYPTWDKEYEKELISQFHLDNKSKFKDLSRGEKAKLFLIFALAHRPELIIMDEPTSHLDPVARSDFWESTIAMISETKTSILISTHILADIEKIADEYVLLKDGKVEFQMDEQQLRENVKKTTLPLAEYEKIKNQDNLLFARRIAEEYEIYMENPDIKGVDTWQSLSVEEIIVSYLRAGNGNEG